MKGVMSCPAGRKFCGCPELVEKLLSCLDINSIHSLCQALPSVVKVVRGNTFWTKLIRRTCITPVFYWDCRLGLSHLTGILKLMKDPGSPLLDLLDLICEKYPSLKANGKNRRSDFVQLRCPRHGSHSVSPAGFLILEKVEAALESTEQSIKSFELRNLEEPTMSNLSSRISRQLAQDSTCPEEMNIEDIYCNSKASAEAILTLMTLMTLGSPQGYFCRSVKVDGDIGGEGWATLREALSKLQPAKIVSKKSQMSGARIEDVKTIWTSLSDSWTLRLDGGRCEVFRKRWDFCKHPAFAGGRLGWKLLEEFLQMEEAQWLEKYPDGILINNIRGRGKD